MLPRILSLVSIGSIGFALVLFYIYGTSHEPIEFSIEEEKNASSSADQKQTIVVDVAGGVRSPGVYRLPVGSRVSDAIDAAGGISEEANTEILEQAINRAQKIPDGAKIYIPKKVDTEDRQSTKHNNQGVSRNMLFFQQNYRDTLGTSHNILSQESGKRLISINFASSSELESLHGVGPATAKKIIDGRPYTSLEELVTKKIVGKKTFENIRPYLSL